MEGPEGVFAGCRPGTLVVGHEYGGSATSQAMAVKAKAAGLRYLEAPVTGGVGAAEQGTSRSWPVAARKTLLPQKPLLETMGRRCSMSAHGLRFGPEALRQSGRGEHHHLHERSVGPGGEVRPGSGVVTEVLTERSPLIGRTAPKVLSGDFSPNFR